MQIADFGSTRLLVNETDIAFTEIGTSGWTAPEVFGAIPSETGRTALHGTLLCQCPRVCV